MGYLQSQLRSLFNFALFLKVDGKKNEGGREEHIYSAIVWHCGNRRVI